MKEVSLRSALIVLGLAAKASPFVIELPALIGLASFVLAIGLISMAFLYSPKELQKVRA